MSTPTVYDFLIDDDNEEEFSRHGVTSDEVLQVLENRPAIEPNRRARRGKSVGDRAGSRGIMPGNSD